MKRAAGRVVIDPVAKLAIVVCAVIMVTFRADVLWYVAMTVCLIALTALQGAPKAAAAMAAVAGFSLLMVFVVMGAFENSFLATFFLIFIIIIQFMPTIASLGMLFETTSPSEMVSAMRRMRVPDSVSVSVATAVRYFPVAREDFRCIRKAMSLRGIKGVGRKVEAFYVPLLISALQTGNDITASAISRGIDNPGRKISFVSTGFDALSAAAVLFFVAVTALAIAVTKGAIAL